MCDGLSSSVSATSGSQLHGKVDFERWQKVPKITHTLKHNSHAVLDGYARERTRERSPTQSSAARGICRGSVFFNGVAACC